MMTRRSPRSPKKKLERVNEMQCQAYGSCRTRAEYDRKLEHKEKQKKNKTAHKETEHKAHWSPGCKKAHEDHKNARSSTPTIEGGTKGGASMRLNETQPAPSPSVRDRCRWQQGRADPAPL